MELVTAKIPELAVILEDDPMVRQLIDLTSGMPSLHFSCPQELRKALPDLKPSAFFVDVHLQGGANGIDLIPTLREHWAYVPILVITADTKIEIVSEALAAGADDFIRKPFHPKELLARLQHRLRDRNTLAAEHLQIIGDMEIDVMNQCLRSATTLRHLSQSDMRLLVALVSAKGTVIARQSLKQLAWGTTKVSDKALDRKIGLIREAVHEISQVVRVESVYGKGYCIRQKNKT